MGWGINIYDLVRVLIKKPCSGYYLRWWYNGWHYWFFLSGEMTISTEGEKYRTLGTKKISMSSGQINRDQVKGIRTLMFTREVSLLTVAGWMNIRIERDTISVYDNQLNGGEVEFVAVIGSKEISYSTGYTPVPGDPGYPIVPIVPPSVSYCEQIIGTQIWMCKNWDAAYPGSKVYNDDETNRSEYGGLYTHDQVMNPGFCPAGWHVPTLAEWNTLINYLGGDLVAGGHLKEVGFTHWNTPNTGADDLNGFTALGSGKYSTFGFMELNTESYFWTKTPTIYSNLSYIKAPAFDSAEISELMYDNNTFASVRLVKDTPAPLSFNDWYLPDFNELQSIYVNLYGFGVGGFAADHYWMSGEDDAANAYEANFTSGLFTSKPKGNLYKVRAIRKFISFIPYALRDVGQAGGLIFAIAGTTYYEAAPSDQSAGKAWSNIVASLIGAAAQHTLLGEGQLNTIAIISQIGHVDSAAKLCNDLVIIP